jgi:acyl-CoA thioesterase
MTHHAGGADGAIAAAETAARALYANDRASQGLGIHLGAVEPGVATVTMTVRPDMCNGHEICHGGFIFALADSAFAFACNSYNDNTVAATGSIDFLAPAHAGDELTAEARELWRTRRNGIYEITVSNQRGERVALFRGRSYRIDGQVVGGE